MAHRSPFPPGPNHDDDAPTPPSGRDAVSDFDYDGDDDSDATVNIDRSSIDAWINQASKDDVNQLLLRGTDKDSATVDINHNNIQSWLDDAEVERSSRPGLPRVSSPSFDGGRQPSFDGGRQPSFDGGRQPSFDGDRLPSFDDEDEGYYGDEPEDATVSFSAAGFDDLEDLDDLYGDEPDGATISVSRGSLDELLRKSQEMMKLKQAGRDPERDVSTPAGPLGSIPDDAIRSSVGDIVSTAPISQEEIAEAQARAKAQMSGASADRMTAPVSKEELAEAQAIAKARKNKDDLALASTLDPDAVEELADEVSRMRAEKNAPPATNNTVLEMETFTASTDGASERPTWMLALVVLVVIAVGLGFVVLSGVLK